MRTITLAILLLITAACDPGASFTMVGGNGPDAAWPIQGDSVHGRVDASAFTIDFSVDAVLDAPAAVRVEVDSASLEIKDAFGAPLRLEQFRDACQDSTPPPPGRSKRCILGRVNLHSTDYDRLDSISVQFGHAVGSDGRVPLIARFVRMK